MEHGFGHVEMGWTIMEYIFSTGVPNDTSKRGTNLQFSQGNKSSILLRSGVLALGSSGAHMMSCGWGKRRARKT